MDHALIHWFKFKFRSNIKVTLTIYVLKGCPLMMYIINHKVINILYAIQCTIATTQYGPNLHTNHIVLVTLTSLMMAMVKHPLLHPIGDAMG